MRKTRYAFAAVVVVLGLATLTTALREGLHNERVCAATGNPSLCQLSFDAGDSEAEAIYWGNK